MAYAPKDLTKGVDVQCGAETKGGERARDVVEGKLRAGGAGGLVGGVGPDSTRVARIQESAVLSTSPRGGTPP